MVFVYDEPDGDLDLWWGEGPSCGIAKGNAGSRHGARANFRIVSTIGNARDYIIHVSYDKRRKVYAIARARNGRTADEDTRRYHETKARATADCKLRGGVDCFTREIPTR